MKLFRKKPEPATANRRRPLQPGNDLSPRPPQAFSYYAKRPVNYDNGAADEQGRNNRTIPRNTRRGDQPHFSRKHGRLFVGCITLISVAAAAYLLVLSPEPRIILLQDRATAYFLQDSGVYKQAAQQTLSASLLSRNKITVNTDAVRLNLLKNYPEIQNVSVALPIIGHQPQVYVEPYKPSFILTTVSNNAFLLDTTGRALATTSQVPDVERLGVPMLNDHSGITVKLGSRALPRSTVSFTETVVSALKHAQVTPASLVLPRAAYELDVYIAETPYYVKFNILNDPLEQAGTFLAVKGRLDSGRVKPAQYIDVRVPERAYYK